MDAQPTKLRIEPLLWLLFSAGGVVAAFLIPVHLFVQDISAPLGLTKSTEYASSKAFLSFPIVRLYLFVLCSLPLFHASHPILYTLHYCLQSNNPTTSP